jgi:predicted DNA-binding protein
VAKERKVKHYSIRFPVELLEEIRELSREEHRSINGTVLEALERYVRTRRGRQPKDASESR